MNEPWITQTVDPWQWWRDALAGKPVVNDGTPHPGFYRKTNRREYGARKTFTPVAYWPENGTVRCREGDRDVDETRALELWAMVNDQPVSQEAYRAVAERNEPWPDEHELVPMGPGHNLPPADDTFEGLRDAIEPLAHEAENRLKGQPVGDQEEADRIANLADRLAELCKKAEEVKRLERKPHDEMLKAIQQKWSPVLALAETYKSLKYTLLTPWLKREEARKKAEAEAAAAAGEPPAAEEPRRPRVGTRGRAMTLKTQKTAEITDYKLCLEFFAESPDVRETVQMLANRAVRAGITVPGTKVTEESKAV